MKEKANKFFDNLKPGQRRGVMLGMVVAVGMGLALVAHYAGNKKNDQQAATSKKTDTEIVPLKVETDHLEKTIVSQNQANQARIDSLEKQIQEFQAGKTLPPGVLPDPNQLPPAPENSGQVPMPEVMNLPPIPPEYAMQQHANYTPPPMNRQGQVEVPQDEIIGDIEVLSVPGASSGQEEYKKKASQQTLYMPTGSFTEATLLSGLFAPTTTSGKGEPVPVLIRIKTLSQLPNAVKANLKGCFVLARASGNLADERAHLRLVNLSCISKGGEAVIDQKVDGYVTDEDGFIGLKGRVVAKMGSAIARSFVAGLFGGIGQGLQQTTQTAQTSSLGVLTTPPTDFAEVGLAGLGQGIADASKQIQTFYMDLAKQMVPVVEILPGKKITIVLSEGAHLDVKPIKELTAKK